ncbi:DinB family protein [Candidatus Amarobacter glycogenicus]|uniref:DinB family protein n=2 Tax=Candidatus Amarobacter glycogenicus TaxID=3140699 RepID=UPI0031356F83|nr:DinB family protein [Dehalococcoidia bacterium]MBK9546017.1 DinB family protein [Dehalococcoidia bacterium]MCC6269440.1 DinB family protein [Dehalococcoidia bacterium]
MSKTPHSILRSSLKSMHALLDKAVEDMTADHFNFRPQEGGVSAFFSLWHYVRTEDNIINFVSQGKPTVWLEGGYNDTFALPRNSQGTGMTEAEANAVQIHDVAKWHEYQEKVWAATDAYLAAMSPAEFDERTVTIKPLGPMSLWDGIYGVCLSHGYRHVGEIEYVRGVQGLGGLTI